jgi:hypothetical protein
VLVERPDDLAAGMGFGRQKAFYCTFLALIQRKDGHSLSVGFHTMTELLS